MYAQVTFLKVYLSVWLQIIHYFQIRFHPNHGKEGGGGGVGGPSLKDVGQISLCNIFTCAEYLMEYKNKIITSSLISHMVWKFERWTDILCKYKTQDLIKYEKLKTYVTVNCINLKFRGSCIVSIFVLIYFQRDATLHSLFISGKLLYIFRVVSSPIIRSTYNCIYSTWYLLTVRDKNY